MSLTLSLSILFTSHLNCYGRRYMIIIQQLMEPGGQREQSTTGFRQFKDILRHVWPLGCWHTQSNTKKKKNNKTSQTHAASKQTSALWCGLRCFQRTAVRTPSGAWEKHTASKPVTVSSTYSHMQPVVSNKTQVPLLNRYFPNSAGRCALLCSEGSQCNYFISILASNKHVQLDIICMIKTVLPFIF